MQTISHAPLSACPTCRPIHLDRLEPLRSHALASGPSDPVHAALSRPAQAMGETKAALIPANRSDFARRAPTSRRHLPEFGNAPGAFKDRIAGLVRLIYVIFKIGPPGNLPNTARRPPTSAEASNAKSSQSPARDFRFSRVPGDATVRPCGTRETSSQIARYRLRSWSKARNRYRAPDLRYRHRLPARRPAASATFP